MMSSDIAVRIGLEGLDWPVVCDIFERAPLGKREPEKLRRGAERSHVVCSAWDGDTIVGFGRALSDGEYQSAIYDLVVLPEYQGRGIGRAMMEVLLSHLPPATILLYAVPGKERFYRKLGFERLATGMARFANPERAKALGYVVTPGATSIAGDSLTLGDPVPPSMHGSAPGE
jgi:aralkylamine N-acetyltransferase